MKEIGLSVLNNVLFKIAYLTFLSTKEEKIKDEIVKEFIRNRGRKYKELYS